MVSRGLALVSGSGGVGRTTLAANLSHIYSRSGRKVLLADLCFGWGGLNKFASNLPSFDEILDSEGLPGETVSNSEYGFDLLTSIPPDFLELENDDVKRLAWVLNRISANYDLVIYDTPSGGHPLTLLAAGMSDRVFLFARSDTTSFGTAYCLMKALHFVGINSRVRIVFSKVASEEQAAKLRSRLMGEMMSRLVGQREAIEPAEGVKCPKCGTPMENKGLRKRTVRGPEGPIELERAYYYCPACKAGFFPPRSGAAADQASLD